MSTLGRDIENYYYRDGMIFSGKSSMEPGTKYIISKLARNNESLSKIIVLCSPEAFDEEKHSKFFDSNKTTAYSYYVGKIENFLQGKEVGYHSYDEIIKLFEIKDKDVQVELIVSLVQALDISTLMEVTSYTNLLRKFAREIYLEYEEKRETFEAVFTLDDAQLELNDVLRERLQGMLDIKEISPEELKKYADLYKEYRITQGDSKDYELLELPEFRIKLLSESYAQRAFELREDIIIVKKMFEKISQLQGQLDKLRSSTDQNVKECIKQCLVAKLAEYLENEGLLDMPSLNHIDSPRFVPIEISSVNTNMSNYAIIPDLVEEIIAKENESDEICLYMDTQGGARTTNLIINAVVDMLRTKNISLEASYATAFEPQNIINNIDDVSMSNRVFDLVSGMDEFLNYGKATKFEEYYKYYKQKKKYDATKKIPEDKVVNEIGILSETISLCQVNKFYEELKNFKEVIEEYESSNEEKDALFKGFASNLRTTYEMIWDDNRNVLDVIKWCLDKQLYQQALTVCESKLPEQLMKDEIFFYATKQSKRAKINELRNIYSNKKNNLYQMEDVIHYQYKSYKFDKYDKSNNNKRNWFKEGIKNKLLFSNYFDENNDIKFNELEKRYWNVSGTRNAINHGDDSGNKKEVSVELIKNELYKVIEVYKDILSEKKIKHDTPEIILFSDFADSNSCSQKNNNDKKSRKKQGENNKPLTQTMVFPDNMNLPKG